MAAPHGVTVPKDNPDTAVLDSLKGVKGAEFDKAYTQHVGLDGHKKAAAAFETKLVENRPSSDAAMTTPSLISSAALS